MQQKTNKIKIVGYLVMLTILVIIGGYSVIPNVDQDYSTYMVSAKVFLKKGDVFYGTGTTWLPFYYLFFSPLAIIDEISQHGSRILWFIISACALAGSVVVWNRKIIDFAGGRSGEGYFSLVKILPLVILFRIILDNFLNLQINFFILFLLLLVFYYYQKKKDFKAGVFLGLAVSLKIIPGLLVLYFLAKKDIKLVLSSLFSLFVFSIAPLFYFGLREGLVLYQNFVNKWLDISSGYGWLHYYPNQSLYGLLTSFFEKNIVLIFSVIAISIVALLVYIVIKSNYQSKQKLVIEYSAFLIIMILLSPVAWAHYWIFCFPGLALIIYYIRNEKSHIKILILSILGYVFLFYNAQLLIFHAITFINLFILALLYIKYQKLSNNKDHGTGKIS